MIYHSQISTNFEDPCLTFGEIDGEAFLLMTI